MEGWLKHLFHNFFDKILQIIIYSPFGRRNPGGSCGPYGAGGAGGGPGTIGGPGTAGGPESIII